MGKIALVFIIIVASATYYLTSTTYKSSSSTNQTAQKRTWIDESGKLHVMGIILGQSTVRDAEKAFRSRVDAAIFMYPKPDRHGQTQFQLELEAYFPSIADHSKVMLKLAISQAALEAMRKRSSSPRMYPNGVARRNLASEDILTVQQSTIRELIIMPSVQITPEILAAQFGPEDQKQQDNDGVTHYTYSKIGLVASINEEGKDKFIFTNP